MNILCQEKLLKYIKITNFQAFSSVISFPTIMCELSIISILHMTKLNLKLVSSKHKKDSNKCLFDVKFQNSFTTQKSHNQALTKSPYIFIFEKKIILFFSSFMKIIFYLNIIDYYFFYLYFNKITTQSIKQKGRGLCTR